MQIDLMGRQQNKVVAAALEGNGPVPMPQDYNEIRAVVKLVKRGVLELSDNNRRYAIAAGVKVQPKLDLLERLRKGPLPAEDWRAVADSKNSLKVRIHRLRQSGHNIEARPIEHRSYRGRPKVEYVLTV